MINYDELYANLISVTKAVVGNRLSTTNTQTGTTPTVYKHYSSRPKPNLPYITINIDDTILPSGWLLHAGIDDETDKPVYTVLYEIFVTWRCYGTNSRSILQQLQTSFSMPSVRQAMNSTNIEVGISKRGTIIDSPDLLSTEWQEGATMSGVSFYINDTEEDPLEVGTIIEKMSADGLLKTGATGDIPVEIRVNNP